MVARKGITPMFTNVMKSTAIGALLLALLWRPLGGYELVLQWVISISAVMVMLQAGFAGKFWLTGPQLAIPIRNRTPKPESF